MKWNCVKHNWLALLFIPLFITGCGGGSSDDSGNNNPPTNNSITVVPSLGKITGATVNIYKADNSTLLSSGELDSTGQIVLDFQNYTGPVVIEVVGNNNAQYFDEASNALLAFGSDKKIHAIAPKSNGTFAVTMLTELAYQKATFPLEMNAVNALNDRIRKSTVPEISNLLSAPTLFDENTTSNSLGNNDAGKYALKLAALAQMNQGDATPALSMMETLTKDIGDGNIDGKDASDNSFVAPYVAFKAELEAKLTDAVNSYGDADLKVAFESFPPIEIIIDEPTPGNNDTVSPTVTSVSPVDEATDVSVNATITATFSEAIKPETIKESNFTVSGVTGIVSYNSTNNTATFTPTSSLALDTTYTATINSNVQDLAGNALTEKTWNFKTVTNIDINATSGALDTSFGTDGEVEMTDNLSEVVNVIQQSDGKIVVLGSYWNSASSESSGTYLIRFLSNGALDAGFGNNGMAKLEINYGLKLIEQTNGSVLVLGINEYPDTYPILTRYLNNGSLDESFGDSGTAIITNETGNDHWKGDLDILPNGKIFITVVDTKSYMQISTVRLNSDGSKDNSFGIEGIVQMGNESNWSSVTVDGEKVVATYRVRDESFEIIASRMVRFSSDGMLDPTFGEAGTVEIALDTVNLFHNSNGKLVTLEGVYAGAEVLTGYLANGQLDVSFGESGRVIIAEVATDYYEDEVIFQIDGKLLFSRQGYSVSAKLTRYNSNGSLDYGFAENGTLSLAVDQYSESKFALQKDGKILVITNLNNKTKLSRYNP